MNNRKLAPWTDYHGFEIYEGDWIVHPSGEIAEVVCLEVYQRDSDKWRARYKGDNYLSRLCLQVGDKAQALKVRNI